MLQMVFSRFLVLLLLITEYKQVECTNKQWLLNADTEIPTISMLHLADLHYDRNYKTSCTALLPNQHIKKTGKCDCGTSEILLKKFISKIAKSINETPNYVLLTGDFIDSCSNCPDKDVVKSIAHVTEIIKKTFPSSRLIPVIGDSDLGKSTKTMTEYHPLYKNLYEVWKDWIVGDENKKTFVRGGYYCMNISENAIAVILNTNLYTNDVKQKLYDDSDPAGQLQFLHEMLQDANNKNRAVHIFGHIPVGESTYNSTFMIPKYNTALLRELTRYSSVIKSIIFGHKHIDTFGIIKHPDTQKPASIYWMPPAVVSQVSSSNDLLAGRTAYRIFIFNEKMDLTDISTYYVNLENYDDKNDAETIKYSLLSQYDVTNFSPETLLNFVNELKNNANMFYRFYGNIFSQCYGRVPTNDDRALILCSMLETERHMYNECVEELLSKTQLSATSFSKTKDTLSSTTVVTTSNKNAFINKSSSSSKRILQLTDIHYCSSFAADDAANSSAATDSCRPDSCRTLIIKALEFAHDLLPNPDYVVVTGDLLPHKDSIVDINYRGWMQSIADLIGQYFNENVTVLPVLGSRDSQPPNSFPDEYCMTYKTAFSIWKQRIGEENNVTFLKGGYYKYKLTENTTVVSLNTNLYSSDNLFTDFINKTDPANQFQFLEDVLKDAKNTGQYIHIIGHLPPGASEHSPNDKLMLPQYNKRLYEIITQYGDVVKLILFGHEHTDSFRIFKDAQTGRAVQVAFLAPSLSPNGNSKDLARKKNPAFRIYEFDDTFENLTKISTYFSKANDERASANWTLEYDMQGTYNMDSLNAEAFLTLLKRMGADNSWYELFRRFSSVDYSSSVKYQLDDDRAVALCAIECVDYNDYDNCLKNTIKTGHVLQFTDFHYDELYSVNGEATPEKLCHESPSGDVQTKPLGEYGDYICDANKKLILHMLQAAKKVIPEPDYILWTGDNFPHIDNYTIEVLEKTIKEATEFVRNAYPNTVILPTFGNHDYSPANAFPDSTAQLYCDVYNLWKDWITEKNEETFLRGGYYKYRISNNVIVLVLNTNLYYRFNKAYEDFHNKSDPAGQFQFMVDTLQEAVKDNSNVHVVAHIAPGVFERTPSFTWMHPEYNQKFIDITIQYASVIKWMIFGHHHTDTFHIVKDPSTGEPVQVYFMAPAVTPWFSTLNGAGSNNPSFRVFDYDMASEELLDIKTYYINLDDLNKNSSAEWKLEYSMKDEYSIQENYLNAAAMNNVLEKIKSNKTMLSKYIRFNSVSHDDTLPVEQFLSAQLCSLEFPDYDGYDSCMSKHSTSS